MTFGLTCEFSYRRTRRWYTPFCDHTVRNAWVIWVKLEAYVPQIAGKEFVPKECGFYAAVQRFDESDVQDFEAIFGGDEARTTALCCAS